MSIYSIRSSFKKGIFVIKQNKRMDRLRRWRRRRHRCWGIDRFLLCTNHTHTHSHAKTKKETKFVFNRRPMRCKEREKWNDTNEMVGIQFVSIFFVELFRFTNFFFCTFCTDKNTTPLTLATTHWCLYIDRVDKFLHCSAISVHTTRSFCANSLVQRNYLDYLIR